MKKQKDENENGLSEQDLKNQDDALKQWTAEAKKAGKTQSVVSEVISAIVDIAFDL
ncbi:MAG: hypothetical protein LBD23_06225 [Oscillospiraceae bacterium]|nr:hypothetical protein [Oscillospiraceae bacterium]